MPKVEAEIDRLCEEGIILPVKFSKWATPIVPIVKKNGDLPIRLACDASPYGVGSVISHIFPNGQEKPVAFASRTLNKAEWNFAQIEHESLGIIFGVCKFHHYLYGRKFTLLIDHRPPTTILSPSKAIPSMAATRMQR
ncbi:hypothetical protein SRHO_G00071210 [Serrasalmus rhombeus]